MRMRLAAFRLAVIVGAIGLWSTRADALPTMVRLGYPNCAACHISPQGGGLLNEYGRGIDEAQSLRAGEYEPSEREWVRRIMFDGRVTQDLRFVVQDQGTWAGGASGANAFRPRLMYRNATDITKAWYASATVTADGEVAPRPSVSYDPAARPSTIFLNSALVHFRPAKTLEIAAGRDQLPSGVNVPDLGVYIKSRNRLGYYDAPTQVKLFWWGSRYQVTPFAFAPGGNEATGEAERGGGTLAEFDVLGHQRTIVGVSVLRAHATNGDRRMIGAYTRLGFGRWGILAEHDVTDRTRTTETSVSSTQHATYGQVFWAVKEWLVASAIAERVRIESPFERRLNSGRLELAARLTNQITLTIATRAERDEMTDRLAKSIMIQAAFKTVQ